MLLTRNMRRCNCAKAISYPPTLYPHQQDNDNDKHGSGMVGRGSTALQNDYRFLRDSHSYTQKSSRNSLAPPCDRSI